MKDTKNSKDIDKKKAQKQTNIDTYDSSVTDKDKHIQTKTYTVTQKVLD